MTLQDDLRDQLFAVGRQIEDAEDELERAKKRLKDLKDVGNLLGRARDVAAHVATAGKREDSNG